MLSSCQIWREHAAMLVCPTRFTDEVTKALRELSGWDLRRHLNAGGWPLSISALDSIIT